MFFRKSAPRVETRICKVDRDTEISYTVLRSVRKTMVVRVNRKGEVILAAPLQLSISDLENFLLKHSQGILKHLNHVKKNVSTLPGFKGGEKHLFLGKKYSLKLIKGLKSEAKIVGEEIHVFFRGKESTENIQTVLKTFYRKQAYEIFYAKIKKRALSWGLSPEKTPVLRVKFMKSRWGSLSSLGYMNLNAELVKACEESIDFVIEHEFCHLIHPNHSPAFYKLLTEKMPDWKAKEKKLNSFAIL